MSFAPPPRPPARLKLALIVGPSQVTLLLLISLLLSPRKDNWGHLLWRHAEALHCRHPWAYRMDANPQSWTRNCGEQAMHSTVNPNIIACQWLTLHMASI